MNRPGCRTHQGFPAETLSTTPTSCGGKSLRRAERMRRFSGVPAGPYVAHAAATPPGEGCSRVRSIREKPEADPSGNRAARAGVRSSYRRLQLVVRRHRDGALAGQVSGHGDAYAELD